jgi:hypothetical protein
MPVTETTSNRHPADELHDVREQIQRLADREGELRQTLLGDGADLVGDEWQAQIKHSACRRANRALLEQRFGKEAVAKCCRAVTVITVQLWRRNGSGEI